MPYVRQLSNPPNAVTTVVGPVVERRRRRGAPLGAFKPSPFLLRYTNGAPLSLTGYQDAPVRRFTNGQPLSDVTSSSIPKGVLVMMAFQNAMSKKGGQGQCSSGRGLGDDTSGDWTDSGLSPDQVASITGATSGDWTDSGLSPEEVAVATGGASIPAMSTIAGAPSVIAPTTATNALSNLLNSLFRPTTYPGTVPAYSTFGTGLAAPAWTGAPVSTGGLLMIAGVGLFVILLAKKR